MTPAKFFAASDDASPTSTALRDAEDYVYNARSALLRGPSGSILASLLMQLSIRHAQDHEGVLFLAPSSAALLSIKAFPTWSSLDKAVLSRIQICYCSPDEARAVLASIPLLPRAPSMLVLHELTSMTDGTAAGLAETSALIRSAVASLRRTHGIACHVVASESSDAATGQTPQRHISSLLASYFPLQLAIRAGAAGPHSYILVTESVYGKRDGLGLEISFTEGHSDLCVSQVLLNKS